MSTTTQNKRRPLDLSDGLPASEEVERLVLGSVLKEAEKHLPMLRAELVPDDFVLDKHRRIFQRVLEMDKHGLQIDRVTVAEELKRHKELSSCDGPSYLVSPRRWHAAISHSTCYIRIVKDKAARRGVILGADALMKRAMVDADETDTIIAAGADIFAALQDVNNHLEDSSARINRHAPEAIHEDGFYGVAGDLVRAIAPQSRGRPGGVAAANPPAWVSHMAGRGPYYWVEGDRHHTNENVVLVGVSSIARKGTSWGRVRAALEADQHFGSKTVSYLG